MKTYRVEYSDENLMDVFSADNDVDAWEAAIELAEEYGNGVRPWYVWELTEDYDEIRDIGTYAEVLERNAA
jgi:hypothetical protein